MVKITLKARRQGENFYLFETWDKVEVDPGSFDALHAHAERLLWQLKEYNPGAFMDLPEVGESLSKAIVTRSLNDRVNTILYPQSGFIYSLSVA